MSNPTTKVDEAHKVYEAAHEAYRQAYDAAHKAARQAYDAAMVYEVERKICQAAYEVADEAYVTISKAKPSKQSVNTRSDARETYRATCEMARDACKTICEEACETCREACEEACDGYITALVYGYESATKGDNNEQIDRKD